MGFIQKAIDAGYAAKGAQNDILQRSMAVKAFQDQQAEKKRARLGQELEYYKGILDNVDARLQMDDGTLAKIQGAAQARAQMMGIDWVDPDPIPGAIQQSVFTMQTDPKMQQLSPAARYKMLRDRFGVHFEKVRANFINASKIKQQGQPTQGIPQLQNARPNQIGVEQATLGQSVPQGEALPNAKPWESVKATDTMIPAPEVKSLEEQEADQMFGDFVREDPDVVARKKAAIGEVTSYDKTFTGQWFQNMVVTNPTMAAQMVQARNAQASVAGLPMVDEDAFLNANPTTSMLAGPLKEYNKAVGLAADGAHTQVQIDAMVDGINSTLPSGATKFTSPIVTIAPVPAANLKRIASLINLTNSQIDFNNAKMEDLQDIAKYRLDSLNLRRDSLEYQNRWHEDTLVLAREKAKHDWAYQSGMLGVAQRNASTAEKNAGARGELTSNAYLALKQNALDDISRIRSYGSDNPADNVSIEADYEYIKELDAQWASQSSGNRSGGGQPAPSGSNAQQRLHSLFEKIGKTSPMAQSIYKARTRYSSEDIVQMDEVKQELQRYGL